MESRGFKKKLVKIKKNAGNINQSIETTAKQ